LFIKSYFISISLALLFWWIIVWGQIGDVTNSSQWVADVYKYKENIEIKSPKIVIVAGSNGLFGIDSQKLSKAFGYPVINDCVNAGIELPLILSHAKRVIKESDIVIMPLEYPLYNYNGEAGKQMIDYIYAREPKMVKELSFLEQFWIFWHISYDRIYRGYFDSEDKKSLQGVYGVHNIDENGDQIKTEEIYQTNQMRLELNIADKNPETYGDSYNKNALGWRYIKEFISWCEDKKIKLFFVPSTLMYNSYYKNNPKERWYYKNFSTIAKSKGLNYIGKPFDYMYDKSLYFNTNFHLNKKGRDIRTEQLIKDLISVEDTFKHLHNRTK